MRELKLPASTEIIDQVIKEVSALLEENQCPDLTKSQILIAVEEMFVNIANYAYQGESGDALLKFSVEGNPKTFSMSFIDKGIPYNPLEKPDPNTDLPAEERSIGGLGIFLVKKTMDQVVYENENGCNILTISKRIQP